MLTREQKHELSREMLTNMDMTKKQYLSACRLIDELELEPGRVEDDQKKEDDWTDIEKTF